MPHLMHSSSPALHALTKIEWGAGQPLQGYAPFSPRLLRKRAILDSTVNPLGQGFPDYVWSAAARTNMS